MLRRPPETLPDPFLFDSEKLMRELDRIREQVLLIPCTGDTNATHFGINNAVSAIWNLREDLRYLISLRASMQHSWATKHHAIPASSTTPKAKPTRRASRHGRRTKRAGTV
jgi:hypothetical protein